jgi:hypothetical protein
MRKRGHAVVDVHARIGSGWDVDEFWQVANLADKHSKRLGRDVHIVAESVDRIVRNRNFHSSKNREAIPTIGDLHHAGT